MRFFSMLRGLISVFVLIGVLFVTGYIGFFTTETLFKSFAGSTTQPASESKRVLKPVISSDTQVREEITYACGDVEVSTNPVPQQFIGKPFKELLQQYSPSDGWSVKDPLPQLIVASREDWDYCKVHRDYRHLSIVDGRLAIFQGPLGLDRTLIIKENYRLSQLPKELADCLQAGKIFSSLSKDKQEQVRQVLEFENDQDLNVFLDGLED